MKNKKERAFPTRVFILGCMIGAPWAALALYERCFGQLGAELAWLLMFLFALHSLFLLVLLWRTTQDPFNSMANVLKAMRQGDYSRRLVPYSGNDSICILTEEINLLADELQQNRLSVKEEDYRLQSLIDKLEIATVILDQDSYVTMANRAFCALMNTHFKDMDGRTAEHILPGHLLHTGNERIIWLDFPSRSSRFLVHRTEFRQQGRVQQIIMLSDLKNPLREEERNAWKRLIRVMGHELNNSLTPIISLAQSLKGRVSQLDLGAKERPFIEALDVIGSRAQHLNSFMQDYSRLAKLPEPNRTRCSLPELIERVARLENCPNINIIQGTDCDLMVDPMQIENLLINIIKNACDAVADNKGAIIISWERRSTEATIWVDDEGPGLADSENLFVPFFSTKPAGTGIGLVLSRQIAEANGGAISLANRAEGGCRATIQLPLCVSE
ncbi:MAG: hypothetical protein JW942_10105 [Opitutales bacterium]|nr:hypothetical protein [Opitutales bacterium]